MTGLGAEVGQDPNLGESVFFIYKMGSKNLRIMMLVDCSKEWGLLEAQGSKYIFNRAKYILSFHFCMVLNC